MYQRFLIESRSLALIKECRGEPPKNDSELNRKLTGLTILRIIKF
jgi:hypothetical protein